ncbi:DsbA family protein [Kitasatospora sp. NBC_00240]|uniref:DsbA family protein n=1 Tax=Kitasatospora sp. NBC_00240 TaxID=2903567 RepID=UPI00225283F7|nr:thioredoxin domain-containing protein [Kitasatospora sp. NBC_00240]MCX5208968.1 DsbA family protein [Kitasatospora sp. NBC_00240]
MSKSPMPQSPMSSSPMSDSPIRPAAGDPAEQRSTAPGSAQQLPPQNPHRASLPTARERIQEAHRLEARSARTRRRIVTGAAIVAVLALAGGTALAIGTAGGGAKAVPAAAGDPARTAGPAGPLVVPANTSGPDGTVITYGKPDAAHTLQVFEDFRCPVCKTFEKAHGKAVQQLADDGTYKIEYHLAAFLDVNLGGRGSRTALAAAGAAANEGVDKFKQFHDVLYANQPEEREDGFGDVNRILALAEQVPGLKTEAFTKAVTEGTYAPWAAKVAEAFNSSGVTGTPTVKLDGRPVKLADSSGRPLTAEQLTAQLRQAAGAR